MERLNFESFLAHPTRPVFFDTETTGFDPFTCQLVAIQMYQQGSPVQVIDCRNQDMGRLAQQLKPLIESELLFVEG